jgi:glycerate kinase
MRVMEILRIPNIISKSDLVITGEGKFDWQSLDGKAVTGLAKTAMSFGVPTIVLAGQVEIGRREWQSIGVASAFSLEEFCGLESALSQPKESLALLAERVARTWNR